MPDPVEPPPTLRIPASLRRRIEFHLRSALPNEGCGLLATTTNQRGEREAVHFFPGVNVDASPARFTMDPAGVAQAIREMEQRGWDLGAIVHSHPVTPATPSVTDRRENFYRESLTVIASFVTGTVDFRAWWLAGELPVEVPIDFTR